MANNPLIAINPDGKELKLIFFTHRMDTQKAKAVAERVQNTFAFARVTNFFFTLNEGAPGMMDSLKARWTNDRDSVMVDLRSGRKGSNLFSDPIGRGEIGHHWAGEAAVDTSPSIRQGTEQARGR